MLDFPIKTLNYIKRVLLRQQKDIEKNIEEVEKDDPVKVEALAESSEPGTDSYIADVHTKAVVFKQKLKETSSSIKNALQKIRKGTYGKCEKCGKQIESGRLLAMPIAALCLACSKKITKR